MLRIISTFLSSIVGIGLFATPQTISTPGLSIETELGTHLIDRGETLTNSFQQTAIIIETETGFGAPYLAINRLTPLGENAGVFGDEFELALGLVVEQPRWAWEIGYARIENPEHTDEATNEITGALSFDRPFAPGIAGFYDLDTEDFGLEAGWGFDREIFGLQAALKPRAGFVSLNQGNDRTYLGAEVSIAHSVTGVLSIEGFASAFRSDEKSFASSFSTTGTPEFTSSGEAIGVRLSYQR